MIKIADSGWYLEALVEIRELGPLRILTSSPKSSKSI